MGQGMLLYSKSSYLLLLLLCLLVSLEVFEKDNCGIAMREKID